MDSVTSKVKYRLKVTLIGIPWIIFMICCWIFLTRGQFVLTMIIGLLVLIIIQYFINKRDKQKNID